MSPNPKHIVPSDSKNLVVDALKGVVALNPNVRLDEEYKVIHRASHSKDKVAIISGGGSGHEPSHAGYVGKGLLAAAVCGNTFASPNTGQIKRGLQLAANSKGTLIVIMRYTGDVLHFGLAKEQTAAQTGQNLRLLAVGDDVAVGREQGKMVGRRGLAGTILVYKVAGALAEQGASLDDVYNVGLWVSDNIASFGAGLDHCHIPGTGASEHTLAADEMELGMGIHNEAGIKRTKIPSTHELVEQMVAFAVDTADKDRSFVPFKNDGKDEIVLMVNNLGGVSELELASIVGAATEICAANGLKIRRLLAGTYMTSLNMPGFSLSLLRLPREGESAYTAASILELLDAPGEAPGWAWTSRAEPVLHQSSAAGKSSAEEAHPTSTGPAIAPGAAFIAAIQTACKDVIAAEPEITRFDTIAGDGDCGLCLEAGGKGILKAIDDGRVSDKDVVSAILTLAEQIEIDMDGTSGALYSIFFNGLASGLRNAAEQQGSKAATSEVWAAALSSAKDTLYDYTRARAPSRTLVDPLEAFVAAFAANPADFAGAVAAAVAASEHTAKIDAKAGRASYISREQLFAAQIPDPGAHGVSIILRGILSVLSA